MIKKYTKPQIDITELHINDIIQTSGETVELVMPKNTIESKEATNIGETNHNSIFE